MIKILIVDDEKPICDLIDLNQQDIFVKVYRMA